MIGSDIFITGSASKSPYDAYAVLWHYTPDAVPEPSSLVALFSGLSVLYLRRKRK